MKDQFIKSLKKIAKNLNKEPFEISFAEYTNSGEDVLSQWDLRKMGGYNALKTLYFPQDRELPTESLHKLVKQQRNRIEAKYGRDILLKDEFIKSFKESLDSNPIQIHKPAKAPKSKKDLKRSIVVHFSDTHYGCNISAGELNGSNEYNWTIAARRTAFVIDQAVKYKSQHRDNTELVVLINGDIIAGVIHDQEWAVDLLATQFSGALSILTQAISYAAQHFKSVRVVCTSGNHGRAVHKASKDRAMTHKWDSYENMIYTALREVMVAKHKNVSVEIPETPYAVVNIQGHKYFVTHGDTVLNVGNPGKSININSLNQQINKLNTQLLKGPENFAAVVVGHVHINTVQLTDSGTMLLINGSLSGTDAFAQSVGVFNNHPTQTLFEVTDEHPVGDIRLIKVLEAGTDASLDSIIKPFEGKY